MKVHQPNKVVEIQAEFTNYSRQNGADSSPQDLVGPAKMYEGHGEFNKAIDAYLKVGLDQCRDLDYLEEIWESAVKIAMQHVRNRLMSFDALLIGP